MFLLVIVGEFNSGKSAFVNALLGADIAEEGVTPTTDRITLLRYADEFVEKGRRDRVLEKGYPNEFLREIAIVDTPGTKTRSLDTTRNSPGVSCRGVIWCCSSPPPSGL